MKKSNIVIIGTALFIALFLLVTFIVLTADSLSVRGNIKKILDENAENLNWETYTYTITDTVDYKYQVIEVYYYKNNNTYYIKYLYDNKTKISETIEWMDTR